MPEMAGGGRGELQGLGQTGSYPIGLDNGATNLAQRRSPARSRARGNKKGTVFAYSTFRHCQHSLRTIPWRFPRMSDERFDGKKIYKHMSASMAVYDIMGRFIHKANSAGMPEYEIRGDQIYKARSASSAVFDIRGDHIHKAGIASQALYEIR